MLKLPERPWLRVCVNEIIPIGGLERCELVEHCGAVGKSVDWESGVWGEGFAVEGGIGEMGREG